ncbi:acyl-CoA N-acyltransferase [Cristinia sonorae]|uniref:Acyl-CoA N-acyltransferase n=1 Tax=Cristinia sonorae TaxID=1940300 RepID=A0A8K0UU70_9AGAR|nr:acyl-CoA N-acyltransferase [Cristinia sonorae]
MFTTERLRLRPYVEADLDRIHALWNEPDVQTGAGGNFVAPRGPKWKETYRGWLDNNRLHWIIETLQGEWVGYLCLVDQNPKNRDGEISILLTKSQWGKGYATEVLQFTVDYAFRVFNLHRVSLGVFGSNDRALEVYKKVGFVEEGRVRKAHWVDGAWRDLILLGILDEEWWSRQKQSEA